MKLLIVALLALFASILPASLMAAIMAHDGTATTHGLMFAVCFMGWLLLIGAVIGIVLVMAGKDVR